MILNNIRIFISRFPFGTCLFSAPQLHLTTSQKVIVISMTAGISVIAMLARYLRRRKNTVPNFNKSIPYSKKFRGTKSPVEGISPSLKGLNKQSSVFSGLGSNDKQFTFSGCATNDCNLDSTLAGTSLTPQQLGLMVS